jgi:hypothetical protein
VPATLPWLAATLLLCGGGIWLYVEARAFRRVWDGLMFEVTQASAA